MNNTDHTSLRALLICVIFRPDPLLVMAHSRGKKSVDLHSLLRRVQGMPVNSMPTNNDSQRPGFTRKIHKWEEQMVQIMTVQLEKLEEIYTEVRIRPD